MKISALARAGVIVVAVLVVVLGVAALLTPRREGPVGSPAVPPSTVLPSASPAPVSVTVLAAGDVLLHEALWYQAAADARATGATGYDFGPAFAAVAAEIRSADVAICHLETPLGGDRGPFSGYPTFTVPPHIATALADAGFDSCSTASNHTLDAGEVGVYRTLDVLDRAGLRHAGSNRSATERATPTVVRAGEPAVAHLSYTFGFNGLRRPPARPWIANLIDPAAIVADAASARAAGADIVIVSLHWGEEYQNTPTAGQVALAHELLACPDIDLILGTHAHVVQPLERIGGKWVAYGLGNEIARQADGYPSRREGIMPVFTFTRNLAGAWTVSAVRVIGTWIDFAPRIRVVDLPAALRDPTTGGRARSTYLAAQERIRGYVLSRGAPLAMS